MQQPIYHQRIRNLHMLGLADDRADVNAFPRGGTSALIRAAMSGSPSVVKALIARGAHVDARDDRGRTALHYAAANGDKHRENVRLLLAAGADVNLQDKKGLTPLMVAHGTANIHRIQSHRQSMTFREEVETNLKPLLGLRLSDMWRAGTYMQLFEFGEQRPFINRAGHQVTRADWFLDACCCWLIEGPEGEIVSSDDFGPDGERRDQKAKPFYEMLGDPALQVIQVRADNYGGIRLTMLGNYKLEVWPCWRSDGTDYPEDGGWNHWSLSHKKGEQRYVAVKTRAIIRY